MRILQVLPALEAGGVTSGTLEIARALVDCGDEAHVFSAPGDRVAALQKSGAIHHIAGSARKSWRNYHALKIGIEKIIVDQKIDLVHARSRFPAWAAYAACRTTGVPFITTYHGVYTGMGVPPKKYYNSVMVRGAAVIAVSDFIAGEIRRHYPWVPSQKIHVIPRGVDAAVFDPAKVVAQPLWGQGRIALLPGRLTGWKGQGLAMQAAALLAAEYPDLRLVLLGDDQGRTEYKESLHRLAASLGLGEKVVFAPPTAEMPKAYAAADIVLAPSTLPEAFGRVMVEAAAMGKPVVAAGHGGAAETILPGVTGFLHQPGDPVSLAAGIRKVLNLSFEAKSILAATARTRVQDNYTTAKMQAATLSVYARLISVRSGGY